MDYRYFLPFKENEAPILKNLYDTFLKSVKDDVERYYFVKNGNVTKWSCFSDYSIGSGKSNDVITFSFFPYTIDHELLAKMISQLAPHEIKNTKKVLPDFISFIRNSPILTFSFILSNHKNLLFDNYDSLQKSILFGLEDIGRDIPGWNVQNPHMKSENENFGKQLKKLIQDVEQNKKVRLLKDLFIITSIGSLFATLVCNRTNASIFGWFSDRDAINDIGENFSINLFHIQFIQKLINFPHCQFVASPASSKDKEFYSDMVKIPDLITGALADYNRMTGEITHDKFGSVLRELIAENNKNIFVFHLNFKDEHGNSTCSRVSFKKT